MGGNAYLYDMKRIVIIAVLMCALGTICCAAGIKVDNRLPAGNIVVEKFSGDTVYVKPDLTGNAKEWFYWAMRVRGAQGRTLVFQFPKKYVGARGAVVSKDRGKSFFFAGGPASDSFTWTFGPKDKDIYFYECHPYLPENWTRFLRTLDRSMYRTATLSRSRSGRKVPMASFGRIDGNAEYRVVLTARHHCSESMASWVMEGIAQASCAPDETGQWLRDNVEITMVPFVDYDGVINGDQGKNRDPHDHNRDYFVFLYPETRAVADLFSEKRPQAILDIHCPWISGQKYSAEILHCPLSDPSLVPDEAAEERFAALVEQHAQGLPYKSSNDVPFSGTSSSNYDFSAGTTCRNWAMTNLTDGSLHLCRCFEIPFANAQGTEVNPDSCRTFGCSIAAALAAWFTGRL